MFRSTFLSLAIYSAHLCLGYLAIASPLIADQPKPSYPSLLECTSDTALNWQKVAQQINQSNPVNDRGVHYYQAAREADFKTLRSSLAHHIADGSSLTIKNSHGDQLLHCALDPRGHPNEKRTPENDAARLNTVKLLIDLGADVNTPNDRQETPLQLAVLGGNEAIVSKLINAGATINAIYKPGEHPVQLAVSRGDITLTGILLDAKADINPDKHEVDHGYEPLPLAAHLANTEMVRYLLKRAGKNEANLWGAMRALLHARVSQPFPNPIPKHLQQEAADRLSIAKLLLKAGAEPNFIHEAAFINHTDVLKLLLAAGGDPNRQNRYLISERGRTPLHEAASHANLDMVNALLAKKANVDAPTNAQRNRPLHFAIHTTARSRGHRNLWHATAAQRLAVTKALLKAGANPKNEPRETWTPLHSAVAAGNLDIVQLLLSLGASANAATYHGLRPLHMDGYPNAVPIARLLVKHGADLNAMHRNLKGGPIHYAAARGDTDFVKYLLECGVKIDATNKSFSRQPIHYAAGAGQIEMVKFLLKNGANIEAATSSKKRALHDAAGNGWPKMVEFLLQNGANPSAKDNHGTTPLKWAKDRNHPSCIAILQKAEERLQPDTQKGEPQ